MFFQDGTIMHAEPFWYEIDLEYNWKDNNTRELNYTIDFDKNL